MKSTPRLNISALVAMAAIASISTISASQEIMKVTPQSSGSFGDVRPTSGSANKKAPGANKAAQRAAIKRRKVKAHKARTK